MGQIEAPPAEIDVQGLVFQLTDLNVNGRITACLSPRNVQAAVVGQVVDLYADIRRYNFDPALTSA